MPDLRGLEARGAQTLQSVAAYRHVDFSYSRAAATRERARRCGPRRTSSRSSGAPAAARAHVHRPTKPWSAPIASSCSATASGPARSAPMRRHRTQPSSSTPSLHGRRGDAAGVCIPYQHQRRSVDAAGVRSERPARSHRVAPARSRWSAVSPTARHRRKPRSRFQRDLRSHRRRIHADSNAGWGARVVAAHEQLVGAVEAGADVLMGAVGFLLLIVCANMANLLLARLVQPPPRDGRARRPRRGALGSGAAGAGREPAARRRSAALLGP